ncbi:MAG: heme exporter protein CcmD [Proteobacteria bacterium]|nr:heme exporter protein CcmD [Pseudomonadota bacterium]
MIMQEFFYMDGKAFYVWGSYGITLAALAVGLALARLRKKKILKEIGESLER